ncbi:hypothetical protein KHQ81_15745 (plasmid) [Mycoplasmatota bacterium]|nr:hypothetical protein KHQ81_15745 [Mycoplasmatota bacterium]
MRVNKSTHKKNEFEKIKELFKKYKIKFDKEKYDNNTLHENLEIKHFEGIEEAKDFFNNELIKSNPNYINRYLYWLYLDQESIRLNSEFGEVIDFGNWFSNSDVKMWDNYKWHYPSIYEDLEREVLPTYNYDINVMRTVLYTGGNAYEMANDKIKHNEEFVYECIVYASDNDEREEILNLIDENIKSTILNRIKKIEQII